MIGKSSLPGMLKSKSLLIKLLFSYLSTAIISVLLVTVLNSYWVKKENIENIISVTDLALSNISMLAENMFESGKSIAFEIFNNSYVKNLQNSDDINGFDMVGAADYIEKRAVSNPFIFSVYICKNKEIIFQTYREMGYEENFTAISDLVSKGRVLYPIPRRISNKKGDYLNVYTVIYHEAGYGAGNVNTAVILNIDSAVLYKQIYTAFLKPDQDIFILDSSGKVYLHNSFEMFSTGMEKEVFFNKAISMSGNAGTIDTKEKGENIVYNYVFDKSRKFAIFSKSKYNVMFSKVTKIENTILFICTFVILLIIVLSVLLSKWLYTPINNVFTHIRLLFRGPVSSESETGRVNEYQLVSQAVSNLVQRLNTLEQGTENSYNIMRRSFIKALLISTDSPDSSSALQNILKYKIVEDVDDYFCLVVIRINNHIEFMQKNNMEAIEFQMNSIGNMFSEALKPLLRAACCELDNEHVIIVASAKNFYDEGQITEALKFAQDTIFKLFNIETTVGVSNFVNDISQIRAKYYQAYGFTNYRLSFGNRNIFSNKTIRIKDIDNSKISNYSETILNSIRRNAQDEYFCYIGKLFEYVRYSSYERILKVFFQLAGSIIHMPSELQASDSETGEYDIEEIFSKIKGFESFEELKGWFEALFIKTEVILSGIKNKRSPTIIEYAVRYINDNYSDTGLSANSVADKLSITPQYFSKIFNEYVGLSFPDYINNVKLEKARELLLSDNKPSISDICNMVGYNNRTYFTSTFTKKYGVSPGKYKSETLYKNNQLQMPDNKL